MSPLFVTGNKSHPKGRFATFYYLCSFVLVEMQNWAKTSFVDRALVYTSASILENYSFTRTRDYSVRKTYLIAITGESLFPKVNHAPVRLALCNLDAEKTTRLNDKIIASAIVDRLTFKSYIIDMNGISFRLKATKEWMDERKKKQNKEK